MTPTDFNKVVEFLTQMTGCKKLKAVANFVQNPTCTAIEMADITKSSLRTCERWISNFKRVDKNGGRYIYLSLIEDVVTSDEINIKNNILSPPTLSNINSPCLPADNATIPQPVPSKGQGQPSKKNSSSMIKHWNDEMIQAKFVTTWLNVADKYNLLRLRDEQGERTTMWMISWFIRKHKILHKNYEWAWWLTNPAPTPNDFIRARLEILNTMVQSNILFTRNWDLNPVPEKADYNKYLETHPHNLELLAELTTKYHERRRAEEEQASKEKAKAEAESIVRKQKKEAMEKAAIDSYTPTAEDSQHVEKELAKLKLSLRQGLTTSHGSAYKAMLYREIAIKKHTEAKADEQEVENK